MSKEHTNGEEKYVENGITQRGEGNDVSLIIYSCSRQLLTRPQSYSNLPPLAMFHRKPSVSVVSGVLQKK